MNMTTSVAAFAFIMLLIAISGAQASSKTLNQFGKQVNVTPDEIYKLENTRHAVKYS